MIEVGYAAALLGGLFALVSPCGALLLPAFFAYAFRSRTALVGRTLVFYMGLAGVLVPLGLGSGWASRLVFGHQTLLTRTAGGLLIAFGLAQLLGAGLAPPGSARLRDRVSGRLSGGSVPSLLALGAVSGLAGFCAGPILGAVLTVAAASGTALRGGALLAVYAAGMTVPLFVLALLWDRYDLGRRRWLRGRSLRLGGLSLHTTALLSGSLFIALGALFLAFGGTQGLTVLAAPQDWEAALEGIATSAGDYLPDLGLLGLAGLAVIAVTVVRLRRVTTSEDSEEPT